jgi:hypothetical protein
MFSRQEPAAGQFATGPIINSTATGSLYNGTVNSAITWNAFGISGDAMTTSTSPNFTTDLRTAGIAGDQFAISFWLKTGASSTSFNYNDWARPALWPAESKRLLLAGRVSAV